MRRLSGANIAPLTVIFLGASLLASFSFGQVQTLNRAPGDETRLAGFDSNSALIDSGYVVQDIGCTSGICGTSCGGTVWGTQCLSSSCGTKIGLFPPCPNPCSGTYLGDKLFQAKLGIDHGLKGMFGKLLGRNNCCDVCGINSCDGSCGMPFDGGAVPGCGCSDCLSVSPMMPQPTPAPELDASELNPPNAPDQTDPFIDDSASMGTGTRSSDSARHRQFRGPTNHIRQTSHQVVQSPQLDNRLRRATGNALTRLLPSGRAPHSHAIRRPETLHQSSQIAMPQSAARHYRHRSSAAMRPVQSGPAPEANVQFIENGADAGLRFVD